MMEDKIKDIVRMHLGTHQNEEISNDHSLTGDLGADSLDFIEIIIAVEDAFEVELPDQDAEKVDTVGDLVGLVGKVKAAA